MLPSWPRVTAQQSSQLNTHRGPMHPECTEGAANHYFGFLYRGGLAALCAELRAKGLSFPAELERGVKGSLLCHAATPQVGTELMQRCRTAAMADMGQKEPPWL